MSIIRCGYYARKSQIGQSSIDYIGKEFPNVRESTKRVGCVKILCAIHNTHIRSQLDGSLNLY